MIIKINPKNPEKRLIKNIVNILKKGGVIAYPTDTIYGIGCNIMNKKAIEKIYKIKQMKKKKPLSFICNDLKKASKYVKLSNNAYKIMKRLLPGPYTFILEASKEVPKILLSKQKTAGIRIPNNNICQEILKEINNPIISTSATKKNKSNLTNPKAIDKEYGNLIDIVIDGGNVPGEPSSVISLTKTEIKIIRKGLGATDFF